MAHNPQAIASQREAARRESGKFGEQSLVEPAPLHLVPEPPQVYLDTIWGAYNRTMSADTDSPSTIAGLRNNLASDLPGLTPEQVDSLLERVLERGDWWLRCQEVLKLPGGVNWPAVKAKIPYELSSRRPKSGFRVRDDGNVEADEITGGAQGRAFTRYGEMDEWVQALSVLCEADITTVAEQARAMSDEQVPVVRRSTMSDPWAEFEEGPF